MRLYFQFLICLVPGLLGFCTTLKTILDTVLSDLDIYPKVISFAEHHNRLRRSFITDWEWKQHQDTFEKEPERLELALKNR